jgi:hypothetical protein
VKHLASGAATRLNMSTAVERAPIRTGFRFIYELTSLYRCQKNYKLRRRLNYTTRCFSWDARCMEKWKNQDRIPSERSACNMVQKSHPKDESFVRGEGWGVVSSAKTILHDENLSGVISIEECSTCSTASSSVPHRRTLTTIILPFLLVPPFCAIVPPFAAKEAHQKLALHHRTAQQLQPRLPISRIKSARMVCFQCTYNGEPDRLTF